MGGRLSDRKMFIGRYLPDEGGVACSLGGSTSSMGSIGAEDLLGIRAIPF